MKSLLIIRSVSFQQLDLNLPEIKKKFPDHKVCLLTHPHGLELAKKYKDIDEVYSYDYTGAFQSKNKVPQIQGTSFDAVIIPVTNLSGSSFENVLQYGVSIRAKEYYMCNLISEITRITKGGVWTKKVLCNVYRLIAVILAIPCTLMFALMWIFNYCRLCKDH